MNVFTENSTKNMTFDSYVQQRPHNGRYHVNFQTIVSQTLLSNDCGKLRKMLQCCLNGLKTRRLLAYLLKISQTNGDRELTTKYLDSTINFRLGTNFLWHRINFNRNDRRKSLLSQFSPLQKCPNVTK